MSEILYVSGANMGMSRIAEGLTRHVAPDVTVYSAGIDVDPGHRGVDEDARRACAEIGARCDGDPLQLTPSLADRADVVVILGNIDVSDHVAPDVDTQRWDIRDPADDGVEGVDRYRLLRDDLRIRILAVLEELGEAPKAL
ncbi:low molecular weight phosphatase family protein [Corynebacterium sp. NPDC060344]|uniref:arsenate-mycothiol transferase ArsC n=1 Tax=Corynebacterium sp. NPDC060344 TaxID=3347101 RepID=UPI003651AB60